MLRFLLLLFLFELFSIDTTIFHLLSIARTHNCITHASSSASVSPTAKQELKTGSGFSLSYPGGDCAAVLTAFVIILYAEASQ